MGITLSEISWSHKDKHRVIPRIGGPRGVESAEAESRVVIPGRGRGSGERGSREPGVSEVLELVVAAAARRCECV